MRTATRSSRRKKAAAEPKGLRRIPKPILAGTVLLAILATAMSYAMNRGHTYRPDRKDPAHAGGDTGAVSGTPGLPGVGGTRRSGETEGVSQDEYDDRIMLQLLQLDVELDREIYRFLERNGAPVPVRSAAEQNRLISSLLRLRGHESPVVRRGSFAALGRIPPNTLWTEAFLGAFDDPDPRVRREALIGRTRHGIAGHWSFVMPLLRDDEPSVRVAVAYALGSVGEGKARAALVEMLEDKSDEVVEAAAESIGRRMNDPPTPAILATLTSPRPAVRIAGVRILASARTPECVAALSPMLDDPAWTVRREAVRALASFDGESAVEVRVRVESVAFDSARPRTERFEALQELANTASEPDTDRIQAVAASDPDPALRLAAARTLLARRDKRACATLAALLETEMGARCDDEDRNFVRSKAAQTLRDISGAAFRDDDVRSWRKVVPGLEARVSLAEFEYEPEYLAERW